ncbi:MAG TPA: carboxypeptidase regulatory-like domain-containing protein [Bryobacteraceae bacterium]
MAGLLTSSAIGQISGGVFRGEVLDASGSAVPQANISIRSADTGVEVSAESNGQGLYLSSALIPGSYRLSVTKAGFKVEEFGPVLLQVNQTVRVDFGLAVGAVTDSIRVEADGEQLLSTEGAQISQVVGSKAVAEIPLNGRNWQQLISLSAGVNSGAPGETGSPNPVNVNGQRTKANLFLVDGISTTSSAEGRGNNFNIPLEGVREFSVQAGSYSAEFGNVAGGVINLETKSGTNSWHGSAFEFFRNDAMDAANYFSNATRQAKSALRYNQFGGSLGGPIRHGKTFVFGDYQGTATHNGVPMVTSVPLAAQRTGDFSGLLDGKGALVPIYDPSSATVLRSMFPQNTIPLTRQDPAAVKLTALLPQPNQFGVNGQPLPFNNYAVTRTVTADVQSFDVRLDHQFSETDNIFVRHSFQNTNAVTPSLFGLPLGGPPAGAGTTAARNQNIGIGHIHQFTPALINEIRIGLGRETTSLTQEDYGENLSNQFGIPGVNQSPQTSGLSNITVSGLFGLGGSILTPLRLAVTDWNFSEKLIWSKGRHSFRFGFDSQYELGSTGYLVFGRGSYTFLNLSTSAASGPAGGNAFASFLVGAPFQILRDTFPPGLVELLSPRNGFFVQDDVKVSRRLTVNLGARYDIMPYAREKYNRLSNFDPATGTMLIAGQNTGTRLRQTDYKDLAPRVGLAYAIGRQYDTVIRAGYGIGYIDPVGAAGILNSTEFNIPFYYRSNITEFPFTAPTYSLSSVLPKLVIPSPSAPAGDQRYLVPGDRNQYSQTWSFSIQRALSRTLMMEVAYVGTSGVRLLDTANLNAAPPGTTNPATRQPFGPALGEVREIANSGHSSYNGLQSKIEQRFSHGLSFLASYTWSKSIDNQSNGTDDSAAGGQYPQNPQDRALERGPSSFDRTHQFTGSVVWAVPLFRSKESGLLATFLRHAAGGWQLSSVFQMETGSPFSVLMPCATINAQGNNCRPNVISDAALPADQRSISRWFNTSAFVTPSPQSYGNAGRNILRGPGSADVDGALAKSFTWSGKESRNLQIRWEVFNVLNHTNLGLPVHSTDSPALGSINSAGAARVIQLGARLQF